MTTFIIENGTVYEVGAVTATPKGLPWKQRREWRKQHRLCVQCGCALATGIQRYMCDRCAKAGHQAMKRYRKNLDRSDEIARQKLSRQANPAYWAKLQRDRAKRRSLDRICSNCASPALPDRDQCQTHLDAARAKARRYWNRKGKQKREARKAVSPSL